MFGLERKERADNFSCKFLSALALTHEYSGAVLRLASSFEGLWSLGTASSREGSRPPPNGDDDDDESDARSSSLLPLAATATNRSVGVGPTRRRGRDVALRRRVLRVAPAAETPTTIDEDGADVEAPLHTRSKEQDISFASFVFRERERGSKPSASERKTARGGKNSLFFLSLPRWRRRRKPRRRRRRRRKQQQNQHLQKTKRWLLLPPLLRPPSGRSFPAPRRPYSSI